MKNILFAFCITALFVSCGNEKTESSLSSEVSHKRSEANPHGNQIGEIINGQATITYDIETLKQRWSEVIKTGTLGTDNVLDLNFESVAITIDNGRYFLRGVDPGNTAKSSILLEEIGGILYATGDNTSVTCSGCQPPAGPSGAGQCEPKESEGKGWYCTTCSSAGCNKVVTTTTDSIF